MSRRGPKSKPRSAEHIYGVPVPEALHDAIETERGNLARAESVLGCLAISMEYETDPVNGPYYPDVAQLARELVRQSVNALDSLVLQRRLLRNRVKESIGQHFFGDAYPDLEPVDVTCDAAGTGHIGMRIQSIGARTKIPLDPTLH
jgi:hypothetical protein